MLEVKNIHKKYKTGDLVQIALNDVSLSFRDNEFVSILGPSGSGKTTLLNIIGGLDRYDEGDLIIDGISTKKYKDRDWDTYRNHTIGFVFQSYNLISHQTLLSNVELALTIGGIKRSERKRRALEALDKVGLKDQAHKKPNQLSGGQMQRVAIARALVNNPRILLADEPTGALDTNTSIQVMKLLEEVAKDRLVIMVTHNNEIAESYSNRIVKLRDGKIIDDSNPFHGTVEITGKKLAKRKAKMNFLTSLSLSFNNLLTKKGRTILTAFAGSIGIIGIALILALSTGFQNYVDKIQEDTMSSYPLTIQSDTADIFSALLSARVDEDEEASGETVKEVTLITSMMNSLGTNDLKSYKAWLENNEDKYKDDVYKIDYSYSVTPRIYTIDVTDTITQLNPSTLLSSIYSDTMVSAFSSFSSATSMGAFSQADFSELEENYKLLKGEFPKEYNEVLLVIPRENQISDLLIYILGFRDNKELKTLIGEVMNNEEVSIDNTPMTLTYDDLMNVELKLVNVPDLYKYNAKYDTYEDMTSDDEYMMKIYKNSESLKITGIAVSDGEGGTGGIFYSKDLVDHVIDLASKSEIVKKQLNNKDRDVFSGNKFDEENKKDNGINFDDMVKIDEDKLKEAFKINVSEDDFKFNTMSETDMANLISASSATIYNQISLTANQIAADIALKQICLGIAKTAITGVEHTKDEPISIVALQNLSVNSITNDMVKQSLGSLKPLFSENDIENLYYASRSIVTEYYRIMCQKLVIDSTYSISLSYDENDIATYSFESSTCTSTQIIESITYINAQTNIDSVIPNYIKNITINLIAAGIGTTTGEIMAPLAKSLAGLGDLFGEDFMTIDTNKFAEAFKFDMDEEELSRLMSSMLKSSTASYSNNLVNLGYQDEKDPTAISIYFNDFDSKENFLDLLDNYNETVDDEDKEITYTDITGLLMGSVKTIIDSVTYVLIAFVSISLIVSSIMIAVITLISVMERTKEIGILRAMGASKKDVSSIFNAETFIIGLLSGLLGVGVTLALVPPINTLIHNVTGNYDINAVLETTPAIVLVLISVFLTIFAGIIPSRKASKQDPVIALRTE